MNKLYTVCLTLLLAACGSELDGTYSDKMGMLSYTFKTDGKVVVEIFGATTELAYELDGEKLKISSPQGNQIMTVKGKDSIIGPMGMILEKKK